MRRLSGRLDRRSLRNDSIFGAGPSGDGGKVFVVWSAAESGLGDGAERKMAKALRTGWIGDICFAGTCINRHICLG